MNQTPDEASMDAQLTALNQRIVAMHAAIAKFRKGFSDAILQLANSTHLGAASIDGVGIDVGTRGGESVVIWVECRGNGDIVVLRKHGMVLCECIATVDPATLNPPGAAHVLIAQWILGSLAHVKMPILRQ